MPISVTCGSCGTKLSAPDHQAGKRGKCPRCQATVELISAPLPAAAPTPNERIIEAFRVAGPLNAVPASAPAGAPELGVRRRRRKKKRKGFLSRLPAISVEPGLIKAMVGIALMVALGFGAYYGFRRALRMPPPAV